MPMVNMKRTKVEKTDLECSVCDEEEYPWGLRLSLGEEEIQKLGITGLPKAGAKISIVSLGVVEEVSKREDNNSGVKRSLSIQLTDIGFENEEKVNSVNKLYGD